MPKLSSTQRVYDVVKDIANDVYRLPSIQRSFVWEEDRIYKLMDSLMRDYPIGSFLVWKSPASLGIRTRRFTLDYTSGTRIPSKVDPISAPPYLVLDGQQRFQSLYLAFFGSYDKRFLYFNVASDARKEQSDLRYHFHFLAPQDATPNPHWLLPKDILQLKIEDISRFVDTQFVADPDEGRDVIKRNLGRFIRVFNGDNKMPFLEVNEDLDYNDVLEVFVRVNSGGIVLSKSDLVFATVVLHLPDMEDRFLGLVDRLNGTGEYDFDTDFLIKASFALTDKGAEYDVHKIQDKAYQDAMAANFQLFDTALMSALQFLKNDAKILSKRFLKSSLALIPIIDFIYRQPHQQVPSGQAAPMRQYLYMSFFLRFFSHGADGKLDHIHGIMKRNPSPHVFPLGDIATYMSQSRAYQFSDSMLSDVDLVLNIVDGGVAEIPKLRAWSLERDHIFPVKLLEQLYVPGELIDDVGNLRLVNKTRNLLKSATVPESTLEFYGSADPNLNALFLKAREALLSFSGGGEFATFARTRKQTMYSQVKSFLGF